LPLQSLVFIIIADRTEMTLIIYNFIYNKQNIVYQQYVQMTQERKKVNNSLLKKEK